MSGAVRVTERADVSSVHLVVEGAVVTGATRPGLRQVADGATRRDARRVTDPTARTNA